MGNPLAAAAVIPDGQPLTPPQSPQVIRFVKFRDFCGNEVDSRGADWGKSEVFEGAIQWMGYRHEQRFHPYRKPLSEPTLRVNRCSGIGHCTLDVPTRSMFEQTPMVVLVACLVSTLIPLVCLSSPVVMIDRGGAFVDLCRQAEMLASGLMSLILREGGLAFPTECPKRARTGLVEVYRLAR